MMLVFFFFPVGKKCVMLIRLCKLHVNRKPIFVNLMKLSMGVLLCNQNIIVKHVYKKKNIIVKQLSNHSFNQI